MISETSHHARKHFYSAMRMAELVRSRLNEGALFPQRKNRTKTRAPQARHGRPLTSDASRRLPAVADPPGPSTDPAPAGWAVRRGRPGLAAGLPGLRAGCAHSPWLLPDPGVCPAFPTAGAWAMLRATVSENLGLK